MVLLKMEAQPAPYGDDGGLHAKSRSSGVDAARGFGMCRVWWRSRNTMIILLGITSTMSWRMVVRIVLFSASGYSAGDELRPEAIKEA